MVLLVEDDPDLREDLAHLIRGMGYPVATAAHGADALEALHGGLRPKLILLDLMMPVMDGWALRAELMKDPSLATLPVVVLSGVMDPKWQAQALGAVGWLTKPIDLDELDSVLATRCGPPKAGEGV